MANNYPPQATSILARYGFSFFDSGARWDAPDATPTHMLDLHRFLTNPFDDPQISLGELLSFSSDHLARMIANNPGGILTARITPTTSEIFQREHDHGLVAVAGYDDRRVVGANPIHRRGE